MAEKYKILNDVVGAYKNVIEQWKKRGDVQSGDDLGWKGGKVKPTFANTPKSIGDGTTTTGWCVSASESLLNDPVFRTTMQFRGARAKLISIDIKEQFYGHCYNGTQNKWHTAIYLEDSGIALVIDVTCAQFGNQFVGKNIWSFKTWESKFRSAECKHIISDFQDNPYNISPVCVAPNQELVLTDLEVAKLKNRLVNINNLLDNERSIIAGFLLNGVNKLNKDLLTGNFTKETVEYSETLTEIFNRLPFRSVNKAYALLPFESLEAATNWIKKFLEDELLISNYLILSDTLTEACKRTGIPEKQINQDYMIANDGNKTYVVFAFKNVFAVDCSYLPNASLIITPGMYVAANRETGIYNGKQLKMYNETSAQPTKTNTIYIEVDNM